MSLIEYTLDGKVDKVKIAIERIRTFDPCQSEVMQDLAPYYVGYSGGKDSDALRILFALSGVKYDLFHSHTTVDAPETVYYVRSIPNVRISYPEMSMWELLSKKTMPMTRTVRYCCNILKEGGGNGRFVALGVRRCESVKRSSRTGLEIVTRRAKDKVLFDVDDNSARKMIESCVKKGKRTLNPIIDWTEDDVWELLNHYGCKSNPLYQEGFNRVGCVGCPMTGSKGMKRDFERWPKYKENYIKSFGRMVKNANASGKRMSWKSGEEVFDWWISDKPKTQDGLEYEGILA